MMRKDDEAVFDSEWYVAEYPDVALTGMDPFEHYQRIGRKLGRRGCPPQSGSGSRNWTAASEASTAGDDLIDVAITGDASNLERFMMPQASIASKSGVALSPLMQYIWSSRPDLQAAFDLDRPDGRDRFAGWCKNSILAEYEIPPKLSPPARDLRDDGVNLIGYPRTASGMGEQLRGTVQALIANGAQFAIRDIHAKVDGDQSVARWITETQPYRTSIFHVNADMYTIEVLKYGNGHRNIGYWAWELAESPPAFAPAIQLVDEIWGISDFVSEAFRKVSDVPVFTMPQAVLVPEIASGMCSTARFGLEPEAFTFLFTFDAASYLDRKNPVDTVRAFNRAFPQGTENVQLVLKTHNVAQVITNAHAIKLWSELLAEIGDSPRIRMIDVTMDREEICALTAACDAFVSLHRSEGFGRNLAEAMLYGRPVIATGYSGSNEFIRAETAIPIDFALIPVGEGAYPHGSGQYWAQPDIDHAAWAMRRMVEDQQWHQDVARAGQAFVRTHFNENVVGQRYVERLVKLHGAGNPIESHHDEPATVGETDVLSRLHRHVHGKSTVLFTIVSCNYMAFARTVLQSVRKQHPEFALFICLVDEGDELEIPEATEFQIVRVRDIDLPDFLDMRLRYDVMELNTAVKPFFIDWIYSHTQVDKVIYFDPDLFLYQPLDNVLSPLDAGHSVILTPHINRPIDEDECFPSDHTIMQSGVFNLGFIATRRTDETRRFIQWWARKLETLSISDVSNNLFTDQRWCDFAPCFLPALKVLHHSGHNVAYWNLDQRRVERLANGSVVVNDQTLVFFHFSGFHPRKVAEVSKHQTRFSWTNISPTTRELMEAYAERLLANNYETATKQPYSYNEIDGMKIRPVMRQVYREEYPNPHVFRSKADARARLAQLCLEPSDTIPGDGGPSIIRLMKRVYDIRPDVRTAFPIATADGAAAFRNWFNHSIRAEYGIDLDALASAVEFTPA